MKNSNSKKIRKNFKKLTKVYEIFFKIKNII